MSPPLAGHLARVFADVMFRLLVPRGPTKGFSRLGRYAIAVAFCLFWMALLRFDLWLAGGEACEPSYSVESGYRIPAGAGCERARAYRREFGW
eukprot:COSAG01_NODE_5965_length_3929_cov_4.932898_1_plen_93_part_00